MPNAWQAARIVQEFVEKAKVGAGNTDDDIHDRRSYLASALREHVTRVVENQAEQVFKQKLSAGEIRFSLEVGQPQLPHDEKVRNFHARQLQRSASQGLSTHAAQPVRTGESINSLTLTWNATSPNTLMNRRPCNGGTRLTVRQSSHYYLRGWKQNRIWPDFIAHGHGISGEASRAGLRNQGRASPRQRRHQL